MKSVMISINPKYCELIASGKKTIEVRKTKPKIETPFKCYIYCTTSSYKGKYLHTSNKRGHLLFWENPNDTNITVQPENYNYMAYTCRGKVIGEFVCDKIDYFSFSESEWAYSVAPAGSKMPMHETNALKIMEEQGCLLLDDINAYFGDEDYTAYFWHISNLVIYDKPKELFEFYNLCDESLTDKETSKCKQCIYHKSKNQMSLANEQNCVCDGAKPLTRPPRSWCYVESVIG